MKFNFLIVFEIFFKLKFSKFVQDIRALERFCKFLQRFFSKVSPSSYLGQTEGLAENSKPTYEVCDYKSEKSAPMYCLEGTPLRYSAFAWIVGFISLDFINQKGTASRFHQTKGSPPLDFIN